MWIFLFGDVCLRQANVHRQSFGSWPLTFSECDSCDCTSGSSKHHFYELLSRPTIAFLTEMNTKEIVSWKLLAHGKTAVSAFLCEYGNLLLWSNCQLKFLLVDELRKFCQPSLDSVPKKRVFSSRDLGITSSCMAKGAPG